MRRFMLATATALGVLLLAAALLHAYAWSQWRASFGSGGYPQRLAEAERAARLEPWNRAFACRPPWLRGEEAMRRNRPADGYRALHDAADIDNRDPRLRAELRAAYDAWYRATTWKAHAQHAKEQTGGVLLEKDHIP